MLEQLVARGEHTDARASNHAHAGHVDAREYAEMRGLENGAGREDEVAGVEVAARTPDVVAVRRFVEHPYRVVAVAFGPLDHHDRVGAVGQGRARHDADRLTVANADARGAPRR